MYMNRTKERPNKKTQTKGKEKNRKTEKALGGGGFGRPNGAGWGRPSASGPDRAETVANTPNTRDRHM